MVVSLFVAHFQSSVHTVQIFSKDAQPSGISLHVFAVVDRVFNLFNLSINVIYKLQEFWHTKTRLASFILSNHRVHHLYTFYNHLKSCRHHVL